MTATVPGSPSTLGRPPGVDPNSTGVNRPMPVAPLVPLAHRRRKPALLAVALACIASGALATGWLVGRAGDRVAVLVLAREVPYGAAISALDLAVADVSLDPTVATVPAGDVAMVVGQVARVPMLAGTLLAPESLRANAPPGPGQVLVALALPATRMPAVGLVAGDEVRVVNTPGQDAESPAEAPATLPATVVRLGAIDLDGVTVIDVAVRSVDGPVLAAWSATGRIAVLLEPAGP